MEGNHIDCLERLHEAGLPINAQKPNGTSALMVACANNNIEATRALVTYGALLDVEDVRIDAAYRCMRYLTWRNRPMG